MKVLVLTSTALGTINAANTGKTEEESRQFGQTMMAKFLHNLESEGERISTIVCYTEGIFNAVKGSETALSLAFLQDAGVKILLCSTCVNFYGLDSNNLVGTMSDMATIVDTITKADTVIRP
ncbi:MAG: DsrE family protein [bacterium]|nr:DsrE family protein [bacterium]